MRMGEQSRFIVFPALYIKLKFRKKTRLSMLLLGRFINYCGY